MLSVYLLSLPQKTLEEQTACLQLVQLPLIHPALVWFLFNKNTQWGNKCYEEEIYIQNLFQISRDSKWSGRKLEAEKACLFRVGR